VCVCIIALHTHTHTHPFNGPFSGTTRVSQYQKGETNLDFTKARDSEWQWHQLGHMQVCILLQTGNHASTPPQVFYSPDALPFTQPTVSKHWRHNRQINWRQTHCIMAMKWLWVAACISTNKTQHNILLCMKWLLWRQVNTTDFTETTCTQLLTDTQLHTPVNATYTFVMSVFTGILYRLPV